MKDKLFLLNHCAKLAKIKRFFNSMHYIFKFRVRKKFIRKVRLLLNTIEGCWYGCNVGMVNHNVFVE